MVRPLIPALLAALAAQGATRTMTLAEVLRAAGEQSPEALLARLDEEKARERVRGTRDAFVPKVYAGSGLAYTSGFPMSIEGSAPTIVQSRAVASLFNKARKLEVEGAREGVRTAELETGQRRREAMAQAGSLYLAAERAGRLAELAARQVESAMKVEQVVRTRIEAGAELAVEGRRWAVETAKARQRVTVLEADRDDAEAALGVVLGLAAGTRVRAAGEERAKLVVAETREEAVERALKGSVELRVLASQLVARGMEAETEKASRYPVIDLVAQYGLFAKFNNYEDFFRRFERHNWQIGASVQIPLTPSPAASARTATARAEQAQLKIRAAQARGRIEAETSKRYGEWRKAEGARGVARLDLEYAREALSVQLARFEEGGATLRQVEEARMAEQERWIAFYEAQYASEAARLELASQTGELAAVR